MSKDSTTKTITVALGLCIVCSILVSTAAVKLRPLQLENKKFDIQKNLLLSTGLLKEAKVSKEDVFKAYEAVETKLVDLETGELTNRAPETFDLETSDKNPQLAVRIPPSQDKARIKMRAQVRPVYFIREGGEVSQIVLPFHGKGLWSTIYGFLCLAPDTRTVKGIGFYSHGETPGLGGEIENKKWQAKWVGKHVLGEEDFLPVFTIIKGAVNSTMEHADEKVDGLSGASLTSAGVEAAINYWVGENGYGKFLENYRRGGILL